MRGLKQAHSKDISCGDYSHNLGLIATGGRDNKVRIWEYEKMKFIDEIKGNNNEVAIVKFLNPFSLLLSADNTGWIHIWLINQGQGETQCIVSWRNNHSLDSHSPVTAVDCHYEPKTGEFYLIMGDERGMVKT
jgi:WD40 repeat protein